LCRRSPALPATARNSSGGRPQRVLLQHRRHAQPAGHHRARPGQRLVDDQIWPFPLGQPGQRVEQVEVRAAEQLADHRRAGPADDLRAGDAGMTQRHPDRAARQAEPGTDVRGAQPQRRGRQVTAGQDDLVTRVPARRGERDQREKMALQRRGDDEDQHGSGLSRRA